MRYRLPCLALHCLALPCLALPCLACFILSCWPPVGVLASQGKAKTCVMAPLPQQSSCTTHPYELLSQALLQRSDGRLEWQHGHNRLAVLGPSLGHHVSPALLSWEWDRCVIDGVWVM